MRLMQRTVHLTLAAATVFGLLFSSGTRAAEFDAAKLAKITDAMQKYVDDRVVAGVVVEVGSKSGTGGSSGVPFLRRALDLTFFPELYAVRAEIGG